MDISQRPETGSIASQSVSPPSPDAAVPAAELYSKLKSASAKNQLQLIQDLKATGDDGHAVLMEFLLERQQSQLSDSLQLDGGGRQSTPDIVAGAVYQALSSVNSSKTVEFLQTHFPIGIVPLSSESGVDYAPLQILLAQQNFQDADQMTLQKLCELAGSAALQRKWLYFTEIEQFPVTDLQIINQLWAIHSEGRFGFSVQREIWLSVGKNWDKFWPKIGWKDGNNWTRYPQGFTWDLTAPPGHLPLSNQLRGVRVIASLLTHPAWSKS